MVHKVMETPLKGNLHRDLNAGTVMSIITRAGVLTKTVHGVTTTFPPTKAKVAAKVTDLKVLNPKGILRAETLREINLLHPSE